MSRVERFNIKTEEEFQSLMNEIDEELKKEKLEVFQRPFSAWGKVATKYNLPLQFSSRQRIPKENSFNDNDYLTIRIFDWYKQRYGEKLKIDPIGKFAIVLRGDAYKVRVPFAYGELIVECSVKEFGKTPDIGISSEHFPLNILDLIENLTENFVLTLQNTELKYIFDCYKIGHHARYGIKNTIDIPLVKQVKGDIDASVNHLFSNPPQYGLSKWSSLQSTEKIIKAYIKEKNINFTKTHDLKTLAKQAKDCGLVEIPEKHLDLVQCNPSIRYGEEEISLLEAIQAHHSSLLICWGVTEQLSKLKQMRIKENAKKRKEAIKIVPFINSV